MTQTNNPDAFFETLETVRETLVPNITLVVTDGGILARLGAQHFSIETADDLGAAMRLAQATPVNTPQGYLD